jgi:hypothetical protein
MQAEFTNRPSPDGEQATRQRFGSTGRERRRLTPRATRSKEKTAFTPEEDTDFVRELSGLDNTHLHPTRTAQIELAE